MDGFQRFWGCGNISRKELANSVRKQNDINAQRHNKCYKEKNETTTRTDWIKWCILSLIGILGWPNNLQHPSIHPFLLTTEANGASFCSVEFNDDHSWEPGSADNTWIGLAPADRCGWKSVRREKRNKWYCVFIVNIIGGWDRTDPKLSNQKDIAKQQAQNSTRMCSFYYYTHTNPITKGLLPGWLYSCIINFMPDICRQVVRLERSSNRRARFSSPRKDWFNFMVSIIWRILAMAS